MAPTAKSSRSPIITFLQGIPVGVANLIPGVSGGTLAVVVGVYERLIGSIAGVFTDGAARWRHTTFLAIFGAGAVAGILVLAWPLSWALEEYENLTRLLFFGFILGSLPSVVRMQSVTGPIGPKHMTALAVGVLGVLALGFGETSRMGGAHFTGPELNLNLIIASAAAGAAMIVPGLSGSLILFLLGVYDDVLAAIKGFHMIPLLGVALGAGVGVLVAAVGIRWLMRHAPEMTHFAILGLVGASLIAIYPGTLGNDMPTITLSIAAVLLGTLLTAILEPSRDR